MGRSLGLTCEVEGKKGVKILGIYAPNAETEKKNLWNRMPYTISYLFTDSFLSLYTLRNRVKINQ